jgi:hypothetical protein
MSGKIPKELVELFFLLDSRFESLLGENFKKAFFNLILLHEKMSSYVLFLIRGGLLYGPIRKLVYKST